MAEDHRFDVQIERCFGKKIAVDPATVAFDAAKDQLHALQTHNAQASPPERQVLKLEIEEALAQLGAAKAALATT